MQDLEKQEQFEIEVLDKLKSGRFLDSLIFTGGTMLRLCYGLNRFSVDLDFWLYKKIDTEKYFEKLREYLSVFYTIRDAENKFYTMLFEIRGENYPRTLKIELRKKVEKVKTDMSIAYSKFSNIQVLVRTLSLEEVMKSKIEAFLNRKEIRDVFDIEFLLKKGVPLNAKKEDLQQLLEGIKDFSKNDYSVKLGSIVDAEWRKYYMKENFKILVMKLKEI
ncbi:nucleotidyl transferase AbiEii/AbiGii toxin family protein [Thermodesulfovibrio yellowstonii]|uniref:nucleotidyl transferase AbiEii/AbiGii toxin family protein n=1 Tax=Thermodesulfovibrio yellowstonii TaxID=28262 RepID=UPI003C79764C